MRSDSEHSSPDQLDPVEVVAKAIRAISDLDVDEALRWVATDLILELPFRSGGHPTTLVGADAHAFLRFMPKVFARMEFHDVVIHGATPSGLIAAEYRSNGLTRTGKPYANTYAAFFEVADGQVTRWREYFNPDIVTEATR
jgi:ketosteroid isomerase-like protein